MPTRLTLWPCFFYRSPSTLLVSPQSLIDSRSLLCVVIHKLFLFSEGAGCDWVTTIIVSDLTPCLFRSSPRPHYRPFLFSFPLVDFPSNNSKSHRQSRNSHKASPRSSNPVPGRSASIHYYPVWHFQLEAVAVF